VGVVAVPAGPDGREPLPGDAQGIGLLQPVTIRLVVRPEVTVLVRHRRYLVDRPTKSSALLQTF
jgi:hypothetical protein